MDEVLQQDELRKTAQAELDRLLARRNQLSGDRFTDATRQTRKAESMKQSVADIKTAAESFQDTMNSAKERIENILLQLPNVPQAIVPRDGPQRTMNYSATGKGPYLLRAISRPHWELGKNTGCSTLNWA